MQAFVKAKHDIKYLQKKSYTLSLTQQQSI